MTVIRFLHETIIDAAKVLHLIVSETEISCSVALKVMFSLLQLYSRNIRLLTFAVQNPFLAIAF